MTKDFSKISIIILNFNGGRHILDCLESVQKSKYPNYEIIVVDNGSKDGSSDLIKKRFPKIKLILNKKNLGFTGGNNKGIKKADGSIIFLLNDDTIIHPDLLGFLVKELESSFDIGIAGPKIYFMPVENKPDKIWFAGGKIDWAKARTFHLGRNLTDKELTNDSQREVDFITGCALMIKKSVVEKIGLLDNIFFAFYEDADWCQKAKKAGYKVVYVPFGGVWHVKSATAGKVFFAKEKEKNYLWLVLTYLWRDFLMTFRNYRNRFIFFMRHAPFKYKIIFLMRFIFVFTPQFLWALIKIPKSLFKISWKHI